MSTSNPEVIGRGFSRTVITLAGLLALLITLLAAAIVPKMAHAGAYPVRLCSPEYADGSGAQKGTFNGSLGPYQQYLIDKNGNYSNSVPNWNVFAPALQCGYQNANNAAIGNWGFEFFQTSAGVVDKGAEAGLEWHAPAGTEFSQVSFNGRAVQADSGSQGGIYGAGAFIQANFVGGEKHAATVTTDLSQVHVLANTAQHASVYRLGILCDPQNGGSVCFGGSGRVARMNDLVFVMLDNVAPSVSIGSSPITNEQWVSGTQTVNFTAQDGQSGLRQTTVYVDNNQVSQKLYPCNTVNGTASGSGSDPMGTSFQPCPQSAQSESIQLDTTKFGDGQHILKVCAKDFGQWSQIWGGGPETCTSGKQILIDNTAPSAPEGAAAIDPRIPRSVNPDDVSWNNPGAGDQGSPIHTAQYQILNQAGNVVVNTKQVENGENTTDPANTNGAKNITDIPSLDTPAGQGEYTLQVQVEDAVGHVSKVTDVPLSYSCNDSGGTPLPQADIAMGLVKPNNDIGLADDFLALDQGDKSDVVGKVRGPGQMPINGADICVNAKPIVDPQLQLLSSTETNGNGNYETPLPPGPSRNMLAVFRQGHRETWSDQVNTEVTVEPTLSTSLKGGFALKGGDFTKVETKKVIKSGTKVWFQGSVPGPYSNQVVVDLQGKAAGTKNWRAFRRYRTRNNGKFKVPNRFGGVPAGKTARLKVRAEVRFQVGYPYHQGSSKIMTLVIKGKKKKK